VARGARSAAGPDSSSDGTLTLFATLTGAATNLTPLAARLPHRSAGERTLAMWRSDFRR